MGRLFDNGDDWIGHRHVHPASGRKYAAAPHDPRAQKDGLFTVLQHDAPVKGEIREDAWMGNRLTDPQKGKGIPLGPDQLRSRCVRHN